MSKDARSGDFEIPDDDVALLALLRSDEPLARARMLFSSHSARIEQAHAQRRPPGPIETRRMEFEAVIAIARALGSAAEASSAATTSLGTNVQ